MSRRQTILSAYLLDWAAGDPEWMPHPVRWMGQCIRVGERLLRKPGQSARYELAVGAALAFSTIGIFCIATRKTIAWTYRRSRGAGIAAEVLLGWTCLASRSLRDEAVAVLRALEKEDLPSARERLARIVGRDTHSLDSSQISRAVIETLAESASDGIVAPLFYMALGGVPLAMAYKTINTLDSMIGHADQRYFYFGKVAARLDDAANCLPARLTALTIATAAALMGREGNGLSALRTWTRDGSKHRSPNAGQPESAMAGALQVRLGGENTYAGEPMATPLLGAEFDPPSPRHARQALRLMTVVSIAAFLAAMLMKRAKR